MRLLQRVRVLADARRQLGDRLVMLGVARTPDVQAPRVDQRLLPACHRRLGVRQLAAQRAQRFVLARDREARLAKLLGSRGRRSALVLHRRRLRLNVQPRADLRKRARRKSRDERRTACGLRRRIVTACSMRKTLTASTAPRWSKSHSISISVSSRSSVGPLCGAHSARKASRAAASGRAKLPCWSGELDERARNAAIRAGRSSLAARTPAACMNH